MCKGRGYVSDNFTPTPPIDPEESEISCFNTYIYIFIELKFPPYGREYSHHMIPDKIEGRPPHVPHQNKKSQVVFIHDFD